MPKPKRTVTLIDLRHNIIRNGDDFRVKKLTNMVDLTVGSYLTQEDVESMIRKNIHVDIVADPKARR